MKRLRTFLLAAIAIVAFACTQKTVVDYTLISGKLENYQSGDLIVMGNDRKEIKIAVATDGTFADTIKKEGQLFFMLDKSYTNVYAINGANLVVAADAADFSNTIIFSGEKAGMSSYMVGKLKIKSEADKGMKELFAAEEPDFMAAGQKLQATMEADLAKYTDISDELRALEKRSIKAAYISSLISYPSYHAYFTKVEDYKASEELLKASENYNYDDGELYDYSEDYKRLLMGYSSNKVAEMFDAGEIASRELGNLLVAEEYKSKNIREAMLFGAVANSFARAENKEVLYEKYMALAKDEGNRATVTEKYNAVSKLDKGKPSPRFNDYENYAGGTSSLDDFNGKYVYIDVWATWCGPCKAEIPHLQKVEEKYHGKNIEFVSISVDKAKDKQAWKAMIADKKMGGVQLIAPDTKFLDDYVIAGIPRFILIDPQGNIVKRNALRPSDEKLVELFNELGI